MSEGDDNKVNQAGSEPVKTNAEAISQQAPGSNPGSDDPSGGIAAGSGGVSSAAYVLSPVPNEQKSVVQATVDTVKSYFSGLSLVGGGSKPEEQDARNAGEDEAAAPTDSADPAANSTAKDEAMADSDQKDGAKTDTANEESKALDQNKSADVAETDTSNQEAKAAEDSEAPKESGESELKKTPTGKENREAIPTAGGERLGDKHWGESKIVPDAPKKQEETPGVSSEEGQPDKATKDNTAQNTGGAPPPSSSTATGGGERKQSLKDKIKGKLKIGSKTE